MTTPTSKEAILTAALEKIEHSMRQAKCIGNDRWREIDLSHNLALSALATVAASPSVQGESIDWPEGYCRDPNGIVIPPAGKQEDFSFGYNMGYADGLVAIKDSVKAIEARVSARLARTAAPSEGLAIPNPDANCVECGGAYKHLDWCSTNTPATEQAKPEKKGS